MSARKELNEVQRLVFICVAEAMNNTVTAAMEALIALPLPPVNAISENILETRQVTDFYYLNLNTDFIGNSYLDHNGRREKTSKTGKNIGQPERFDFERAFSFPSPN